jgi:hypothetical protein
MNRSCTKIDEVLFQLIAIGRLYRIIQNKVLTFTCRYLHFLWGISDFVVPYWSIFFSPWWLHNLLIVEASRTHTDTPHSGGLLWTRDRSVVETSTNNTQHSQQASMSPGGGLEPSIPASERPLGSALVKIEECNMSQDISVSAANKLWTEQSLFQQQLWFLSSSPRLDRFWSLHPQKQRLFPWA